MTVTIQPERPVSDVIAHYLKAQRGSGSISTADAIACVRAAVPDCPMTDRELAEFVAGIAMAAGIAVVFDME